ncbi:SH3 domain-containing protein [Chitinophaga sp. Hz27]|uniref:SH3 domain-containing protein n=1 Tax=Chitinophaga sp. Hz27 TaxID=3347169 RepID=UPI0035D6E3AE
MKKLLLAVLLFATKSLFAQEGPDFSDMRSWCLYGDSLSRYIFADTAFVRVSPDTKQAPKDTLLLGDNIKVLEITEKPLTIRGLKGPWLKIEYTKNGEVRNGYVWQGLISCAQLRRGDTKFIYAIERRADSVSFENKTADTIRRFLVRLKAVQNGNLVAKIGFIAYDDESANYCGAKIMSGMGLTNVQNMIVITFSGEACGIPTSDYYFAWTKDSMFVRFPDKTNIGDADAFYHSEEFIFPNEKKGQPDLVVWEMNEEEATDEVEKNGLYKMKTTDKGRKVYQWDGENKKITLKGK